MLIVDMAHFAGLVAAGLHPSPIAAGADVVTTTIHKTLGGPRAGMILCREEHAKKIDSAVFPGQQGGPLEHVIAAQGRRAADREMRAFVERQQRTIDGAKALAAGAARRRRRGRRADRRHRRAPRARRPARRARAERQAGRGSPARDRHHRQPQRGPVRSAAADGGIGAAHRHAGAGDPRPAGRGLHRGRQDHRGGAGAGLRGAARELAERVAGDRRALPLYASLAPAGG